MPLVPRGRTVRRGLLGLTVGAAAGWLWALVQRPSTETAPAGTSLAAPRPPASPPTPAERRDEADHAGPDLAAAPPVAPGLDVDPAPPPVPSAEPIAAPAAGEPAPAAGEPAPVAPVRTTRTRARATLAAATEALGDDAAPAPTTAAKPRARRASTAGPGAADEADPPADPPAAD